jgi:cation diffusion facilitator CzcD-associated flavoprotein CzcO
MAGASEIGTSAGVRRPAPARHCIVGAGYAGIAAAKAYRDRGITYDQLEATDRVGGTWAHRVYDSLHLITSRASTQYPDHPMPPHYPDFPSGEQMLAYLEDYVRRFELGERIEFGAEVVSCRPLGDRGLSGWRVELASGEERDYAGIVVANGQYRDRRIPAYPGQFAGRTLHAADYKRPDDLAGPRVLVVGAGNSACDLVVDAAAAFGGADVSVRSGSWFVPKTLFGIPASELDRWWLPTPVAKVMLKAGLRIVFGRPERYGLKRPEHDIFAREVTINSQLLHALRDGRIRVRPAIARLEGSTVRFVDGTCAEYDTIAWATGYEISLPFIDERLLDWQEGAPVLIGHVFPPRLANLAIFGLIRPRSGAGSLVAAGAQILAQVACLQPRMPVPFAEFAGRVLKPSNALIAGTPELRRDLALARSALWILNRRPELARALATARHSRFLVPEAPHESTRRGAHAARLKT